MRDLAAEILANQRVLDEARWCMPQSREEQHGKLILWDACVELDQFEPLKGRDDSTWTTVKSCMFATRISLVDYNLMRGII
jgi:hypothetical protein